MVRLSLVMGRTVAELESLLTPADLALYQAVVEVDGPWWGEREASYLRQLAAVQAAAAGAAVPAERFRIDWALGPAAAADLLPSNDGLALFAARHELPITQVSP